MALTKKAKTDKLQLRGTFDPSSFNLAERTIEVTFATETADVRKYDYMNSTYFNEILVCEKDSVRMDRINAGAPFLDNHNSWGGVGKNTPVLGVVDKAVIEKGVGRATLRFSKRADVEDVMNDVKDGILTNISVGYRVHTYERQPIVDGEVPTYRALDWEPFEISLVVIPADIKSKVRSSEAAKKGTTYIAKITDVDPIEGTRSLNEETENEDKNKNLNETNMKERALAVGLSENATLAEIEAAENKKRQADIKAAGDAAVVAERARVTAINDCVRKSGLDMAIAEAFVNDGKTIDEVRAAVIDKIAEKTPPVNGNVTVGATEDANTRSAIEEAIDFRANPGVKVPEGKAKDYLNLSMLELSRKILTDKGHNINGLGKREIASMALGLAGDGMRADMGISDFPIILGNTINRVLRRQYDLLQPTFTPFCQKGSAKDFRPMTKAQIGDVAKMDLILEGGEYKASSLPEAKEVYSVQKYGKKIAFTWESIINDDLSAFSRVPNSIASKARQLQSDIVYGILSTNGTMGDGVALFDAATHGNFITGPGTVINVANLQVGRKAIRTMKDLNGVDVLNLVPKFLIVGPAREMEAYQYTSTNYVPTANSGINPTYNTSLQVIVDPRLTGNEWYLVADPSQIDTIEYSFLEGDGELFTERRLGFDIDGLEIKARMVFGAKAIDWRGMFKNAGA